MFNKRPNRIALFRVCSSWVYPRNVPKCRNHRSFTNHGGRSMSRILTVGGAQLGPIARNEPRGSVVQRMLALLREAKERGCGLVVYPELALTSFFPRWHIENEEELNGFYEREMPNEETRPLFEEAARLQIGFHLGVRGTDRGKREIPPLQYRHPRGPVGPRHRQVPQDPSSGPRGRGPQTHVSAPRKALLSMWETSVSRFGRPWAD